MRSTKPSNLASHTCFIEDLQRNTIHHDFLDKRASPQTTDTQYNPRLNKWTATSDDAASAFTPRSAGVKHPPHVQRRGSTMPQERHGKKSITKSLPAIHSPPAKHSRSRAIERQRVPDCDARSETSKRKWFGQITGERKLEALFF